MCVRAWSYTKSFRTFHQIYNFGAVSVGDREELVGFLDQRSEIKVTRPKNVVGILVQKCTFE